MSEHEKTTTLSEQDILEAIGNHAVEPLPKNALDKTLGELGYDSLAAIELQLDLEVLVGRPLGIDRVARRGGLALKLRDLVQLVLQAEKQST